MGINTKLPENCCDNALRVGREIREREGFLLQEPSVLSEGGLLLRAKVRDSFNFVDHPQVELDAAGETVLRFRCDCPDHRVNHLFCAHCVALVLAFEEERPSLRGGVTAPEETGIARSAEEPPERAGLPDVMDFSYAFCNSGSDLYPGMKREDIRIPLRRYIQAFGDHILAKRYYDFMGVWGGSCFGMVATAGMLQQSNEDTRVSDFRETAGLPSELRLTDYNPVVGLTLHQFIELLHILQLHDVVQYEMRCLTGLRNVGKLAERVEAFQRGEAAPVLMGVSGAEGGHEVLPYRLEHISSTEDVLHIYDPNYPTQTRFAYLEKNEQGDYLNWRFPMSEDCVYSGATGEEIDMTTYEAYQEAWNNRSGPAPRNVLNIRPGVAVTDTEGALLARATEKGVETFREDVYQIRIKGGVRNGSVMLSLPAGGYVCCLEDSDQEELAVGITGLDLAVDIATTARNAFVQVEDENLLAAARITEPNARYTIEIENSSGKGDGKVSLRGVTGAEPLHLVRKEGRLYARGITAQAALYIDEERMPLDRLGKLEQEYGQRENIPEMVHNTTSEEKKEASQD